MLAPAPFLEHAAWAAAVLQPSSILAACALPTSDEVGKLFNLSEKQASFTPLSRSTWFNLGAQNQDAAAKELLPGAQAGYVVLASKPLGAAYEPEHGTMELAQLL
eukprot:1179204-Amphidinium_carterae.1